MSKIKIKINGQQTEIPSQSSIQDILDIMQIKSNMMVVEKNMQIVDKKEYGRVDVVDGDEIEIVGFFGGG